MRALPIRLIALLFLAAPPTLAAAEDASRVDITLDVWFASARYGAQTFRSGSGCTFQSTDNACLRGMLDGSLSMLGLSAVGRIGLYEVGALLDGSFEFDTVRTDDLHLGLLAGVAYDPVRWLRLEGLAEAGGHKIFDIGKAVSPVRGDLEVWLPYVGVRPSASIRVGVAGPLRFMLGLAAFARIDVGSTEAVVSRSNPDVSARYDVGGWNVGIATRIGFEL